MAGVTTNAVAVAIVALLSVLVTSVRSAENYDTSLAKSYSSGWLAAKATWYGPPTGAGPEDNGKLICDGGAMFCCSTQRNPVVIMPLDLFSGGACGFKNANKYPFSSMTSCGNEPLFQDGAGCGSCYQVRRT
jgi:hypothetical protein